jgi:hypothetical protein
LSVITTRRALKKRYTNVKISEFKLGRWPVVRESISKFEFGNWKKREFSKLSANFVHGFVGVWTVGIGDGIEKQHSQPTKSALKQTHCVCVVPFAQKVSSRVELC